MSPYMSMRVIAALALAGAIGVAPINAQPRAEDARAEPEVRITEFSLPISGALPGGIVAGPDGALWFYETGSNQIGRITIDGQITEFLITTANASQPNQGFVGVGPDGDLVHRKPQLQPGAAHDGRPDDANTDRPPRAQPLAQRSTPLLGLTVGPDGGLWFTGAVSDSIWRLGMDGQTAEYVLPTAGATPGGIAVGSDGALWFTEVTANRRGRPIRSPDSKECPISRGDRSGWCDLVHRASC